MSMMNQYFADLMIKFHNGEPLSDKDLHYLTNQIDIAARALTALNHPEYQLVLSDLHRIGTTLRGFKMFRDEHNAMMKNRKPDDFTLGA